MEEQIEERGRDHRTLRDTILHLPGFGLGVAVLHMRLSAGDEVGEPLFVVGVEISCEDL